MIGALSLQCRNRLVAVRLRTAMNRIKAIKRKVSDIRSGADGIQLEAEALRDEVNDSLAEMETILHKVGDSPAERS